MWSPVTSRSTLNCAQPDEPRLSGPPEMLHSGDHNSPKFSVSCDTREISEVNHDVRFLYLNDDHDGQAGARRPRAALPRFAGRKADRTADGGRQSAAGSARIGAGRSHHGRLVNDTYWPGI